MMYIIFHVLLVCFSLDIVIHNFNLILSSNKPEATELHYVSITIDSSIFSSIMTFQ